MKYQAEAASILWYLFTRALLTLNVAFALFVLCAFASCHPQLRVKYTRIFFDVLIN